MNVPFDPDETNGASAENDDPFGENSMTWGAADPEFDRMLRERIGPPPTMTTPAYAFERVLLAGRRRRSRKVWAAGAAAALVVMAGTAGTTVAFNSSPSNGVVGPASSGTQSTTKQAAPTTSAPASASPSASGGPTLSPTPPSTTPPNQATSTTASVPQCHSDDMQLTVSTMPGGNSLANLLIVLRNNSGHSCTTYGYPGLQTETQSEQLQSTTVKRVGQSSVQELTIAPGQYVSTIAEFTTSASSSTATPGAGCGAPSYYLAVIPPNEQSQIVATIQDGPAIVCGSGVLDVSPFTSGDTG